MHKRDRETNVYKKQTLKIKYDQGDDILELEKRIYAAIDGMIKSAYKKGLSTYYGFAKKYGCSGNQAKNVFRYKIYSMYSILDGDDSEEYKRIKKIPTNGCREIVSNLLKELHTYRSQLLELFSEKDLQVVEDIWHRIVDNVHSMQANPICAKKCNHCDLNELLYYIHNIER